MIAGKLGVASLALGALGLATVGCATAPKPNELEAFEK
ncbi:MAG: hypothetical protein JWM53_3005, partial [bacterium]|nr:hypothetical protein [bacterium]